MMNITVIAAENAAIVVTTVDSDYQAVLKRIGEQETRQNTFIQARTQQLLKQFTDMESTLNKLRTAASAINSLSQTLTSFANANSNSSNR